MALVVSPERTSAISLGDTLQLQAFEVFSDQSRRLSSATWSTDAPAVLAVSTAGALTGLHTGSAAITAKTTSLASTRRFDVVPSCRGSFAGDVQLLSCTRLSGLGRNTCFIGIIHPMALQFSQDADQIYGLMTMYQTKSTGNVTASIAVDGVTTLTGSVSQDEGQLTATIARSRLSSGETCSAFEGDFDLDTIFVNIVGPQRYLETYRILSLSRR